MVPIRLLAAVMLFTVLLITSGCWDQKEIEQRGYILGAAIDRVSPDSGNGYDLERAFQQTGDRRYRLSYELRKFKSSSGSGETSSSEPEKNIVFSAEGESFLAMSRAINSKSNLTMFAEDMQLLLISEEVAREGIREIFDFFVRESEIRRRTKFFVTKGRAEDFLKRKPETDEINSQILAKLTASSQKNPTIAIQNELGYISKAVYGKRSFSAPMLFQEKGQIKAAGSALFNSQGRMVGIANEYETMGGKIWLSLLKLGLVLVNHPDKPDTLVVVEITESKIKLKPEFIADTVRFILDGEFTCRIAESVPMQEEPYSDEEVKALAQVAEAELIRQAYAALKKAQTVRADVTGFGSLIYRKNPDYWEQVKDRWEEEIFPTVEADVKIKVRIKGTNLRR